MVYVLLATTALLGAPTVPNGYSISVFAQHPEVLAQDDVFGVGRLPPALHDEGQDVDAALVAAGCLSDSPSGQRRIGTTRGLMVSLVDP